MNSKKQPRSRWTAEARAAQSARNRDRWTDPEYREKMTAVLRRSAQAQRDPTVYRIVNKETGAVRELTRREIAERLKVRPDNVARFLRGDFATLKGWRLGV